MAEPVQKFSVDEPNDETRAFLDVERSARGKRWLARPVDERLALAIAQRHEVPEPVARLLAARGVALDAVPGYLNPSLKADLPDPSNLKDMDAAAERLADAIANGETVAVFGDYDVDGATSSALLKRFFDAVGGRAVIYIPDRITEGYGPNGTALKELAAAGASLLVTVDCGVTAHDALAEGAAAGLDIVVVDHHKTDGRLPNAHAVVNPNRPDDLSGCGQAAAVGVVFLLIVALNRTLRARGHYGSSVPEPDLRQWLDLVALGTVCDVVPLTGMNRALVTQGLKILARGNNPGLRALGEAAGLKQAPDIGSLGFALGPRVNAGGRVGEADSGARLLCAEDDVEAERLAHHLDGLNKERREIEAAVLDEAIARCAARLEENPALPFLMVSGEGWHPGVIGIVASRLKDRFGLPAIVCGVEDGMAKGSGRSIEGVDLGASILAAREAGLLVSGGGHAMAAGLSAEQDKLEALEAFLIECLAGPVAEALPRQALLSLDGALSVAAITRELYDSLLQAGPFGAGNPEPLFAVTRARIAKADILGTDHVRCYLAPAGSTGGEGRQLKAMAFRAAETDLGRAMLTSVGRTVHVAGRLKPDDWRGRRGVELLVSDLAFPAE